MKDEQNRNEWKLLLASAMVCGLFLLVGLWLDRRGEASSLILVAFLISYVAGGWDALVDVWNMARKGKVDIHFLMLFVAIGAAFIGAWWEGAVLLFLFSLSGALEAMAMARAEREIQSLFHSAPKTATVLDAQGHGKEVAVDELRVGDVLRVLPGEQFPVDSMLRKGQTAADESMLTGESAPVEKCEGDTVFGGTLNTWGSVEIVVRSLATESAHAKIIRLIREAQESKAPSQKFTDRFGSKYTVVVILLCVVAFCWWYWFTGLPAWGGDSAHPSAFYKAMTLLVVCSPCALVISIPSAILTGIAAGARRGILFRGGVALEELAGISRLALDKTGTLTEGEFEVLGWDCDNEAHRSLLFDAAAALSMHSTHPLSRAIVREWMKTQAQGQPPVVEDLESVAGKGLSGRVLGAEARQGRRSFMGNHDWLQRLPAPELGCTEVIVSHGNSHGRFLLRDAPRKESAPLVRAFQQAGVKVAMLTGDREESARLIANDIKLDDVRAGLSPGDKVNAIRQWQVSGEKVAMVGDGINDAPSLAAADVSMGMGLRGSDAVLEQADVVLLHDRLENVLAAHQLSRRCRAVIHQNIAISLGVLLLLALGAVGLSLPLPIGVLFHEGSTLVVVLNSLRLLLGRNVT